MSIITLTTDLGYRDPYLAIVKAKLISNNASLQIIDLSCDIKDNNISDAAFILKNSLELKKYNLSPFLIIVNPFESSFLVTF